MVTLKVERKAPDAAGFVDVLCFLIPSLQFVQVHLIGTLNGADVMMLLTFIGLALRRKLRLGTPLSRKFIIYCSLWLISQCVTDVVKHTVFTDYARGWSAIGLTIVSFATLYSLLYGRPKRILIYGWGLVVGSLLAYFINPTDYALDDAWKFGYSYPVTLAVILIACRKDVRGYLPSILLAGIGLVHFYMAFRNAGGLCLVVAAFIAFNRYMHQKGAGDYKLSFGRVALVLVVAITVVAGLSSAYQYAASSGMLGDEARVKFERQSSGELGVLVGARPELLSSIPAIIDSPLLGHGSWAKDPIYLLREEQALAVMGYENAGYISPEELEEGRIPAHSHIFGSWVDAGLLGGVFWGWIWLLEAKVFLKHHPFVVKLMPLFAYSAISMLWDILFSPYGGQVRITDSFYIVLAMNYLNIATPSVVAQSSRKVVKKLKTA